MHKADVSPVLLTPPSDLQIKDVIVYDLCCNLGHGLLLSSLHSDQVAAQHSAIVALQKCGATIKTLPIPSITEGLNAFSAWSAMMDRESPLRFDEIIREGLGSMFHPWELLKSFVGLSVHTPPAMLLAISQRIVSFAPDHAKQMCVLGERMRHELYAALKSIESADGSRKYHVIVMPSLSCTAPMHMENLLRIFDTSNTAFFNAMELPVTAVPMGLSKLTGLPTGIQVVAGHGHDFVSIGVAQKLESLGVAAWYPPVPEDVHTNRSFL